MNKVIQREDGAIMFRCPGCNGIHTINNPNFKVAWKFNGDLEKPTIKPSILHTAYYDNKKHVCHSFVTNGKIRFLNDCTHKLAGKTVELFDVNEKNYNLDCIKD